MPNECSREKQTEAANGGVKKVLLKISQNSLSLFFNKVDFVNFLRKPILQNTSRRLLLNRIRRNSATT